LQLAIQRGFPAHDAHRRAALLRGCFCWAVMRSKVQRRRSGALRILSAAGAAPSITAALPSWTRWRSCGSFVMLQCSVPLRRALV